MNNQPPFILRFVAVIMIVFGGASAVEIVSSLVNGRIHFDLGVIGIPLGRGLLVGRQSSRLWTICLSGLGLLGIGILCIKGHVPKQPQWYVGGSVILAVMNCAVPFFGLQTPSVRAWFKHESNGSSNFSGWTAPLALVGILMATPWAIEDRLAKSTLRNLYPVKTRFEFRDAVTGAPISSLNHSMYQMLNLGEEAFYIPPVYITSGSKSDSGLYQVATGVACQPMEFKFGSKGYQLQTFTLNKDTSTEVIIKLQPIETNSTAPRP